MKNHNSGGGWIKIHRATLDHPLVFSSLALLGFWTYLLLKANHSENSFFIGSTKVAVTKGQFVTGRKKMASECHVSEMKIERWLSVLESEQQIEQQKYNKYRIVTILNWKAYQDSEQQNEQQTNNKRTTNEQQMNTNKNDKNSITNVIVDKPPALEKGATQTEAALKKERNPDIEFVLHTFKEVFGVIPIDRKPRFVAHNLARRVRTFIKKYGKEGVTFETVVKRGFEYYLSRIGDKADSTSYLDTVGRHMDQFMEKRLSAVTNSKQS